MAFQDILYAADGPVGVITLNRPRYRNAQGYRMLDEIDAAFDLARADDDGAGGAGARRRAASSPPATTSARPRASTTAGRWAPSPASRPTTSSRSTTSTCC